MRVSLYLPLLFLSVLFSAYIHIEYCGIYAEKRTNMFSRCQIKIKKKEVL